MNSCFYLLWLHTYIRIISSPEDHGRSFLGDLDCGAHLVIKSTLFVHVTTHRMSHNDECLAYSLTILSEVSARIFNRFKWQRMLEFVQTSIIYSAH